VHVAQSRTAGSAIASITWALCGLVIFPIVCSLVGIATGAFALRRIRGSGGAVTGRRTALLGVGLSVAGILVWTPVVYAIWLA
jgi:hypothetical protein